MGQLCRPDHNESRGQTTSEYAFVLGVITVGIVVALTTLTGAINKLVTRAAEFFPG